MGRDKILPPLSNRIGITAFKAVSKFYLTLMINSVAHCQDGKAEAQHTEYTGALIFFAPVCETVALRQERQARSTVGCSQSLPCRGSSESRAGMALREKPANTSLPKLQSPGSEILLDVKTGSKPDGFYFFPKETDFICNQVWGSLG